MKKRKRRYLDSYELIGSSQHVVNTRFEKVHNWEVEECFVSGHGTLLNKRSRRRIGHVQRVRRRCGY